MNPPPESADNTAPKPNESGNAEDRLRRLAANDSVLLFQFVRRAEGSGYFAHLPESAQTLLGWEADALRDDAAALQQAIHPEDHARLADSIRESAENGTPWDAEWRYTHPQTGEIRWIRATSRPEKQPNGDVIWDGFLWDITERKQAAEALKESEELFRLVATSMEDIVTLHDLQGRLLYVSPSCERLLGLTESETMGKPYELHIHPDDREPMRAAYQQLVLTGEAVTLVWRCLLASGEYVYLESNKTIVRDTSGTPEKILSVSREVTERLRIEESVRWQANHDPLTQLPNRMQFQKVLQTAIEAANRKRHDLAVLYLDLDGFKQVNDTLGHSVGDNLLCAVAQRLQNVVPHGVSVARMGGDEFTVLIPTPGAIGRSGSSLGDTAAHLSETILTVLAEPIPLHGHDLFVTASIGIAVFPYDGDNAETLLRHADVAMYAAKQSGSNNYQRHTEAMNAAAFDRLLLENSLRRAVLDRTGMTLHYQPRYSLRTNHITGVEALLRWFHPEYRRIASPRFFPLAEETGLIRPLGEWALQQACLQAHEWHQAGNPVQISVNFSARQLAQPDLTALVREALSQSKMSPEFLEIEITEAALLKNGDTIQTILSDLKDLGVRLAVDDFGTGYSSLYSLRQFPIDIVKIDRSYIVELAADPIAQAIVRAVVDLAHALSLEVIAEGVETAEQRDLVAKLDFDSYQGNLFSDAVPAENIPGLLGRWNRKTPQIP